jgi:exopolyphosphatase/guanosine-5'-triphosphate,3'-diphosphate pyrophosphatase
MTAFHLLMKVHKVQDYKACHLCNEGGIQRKEVVDLIRRKQNINIEIIDGKREAAIIASTDLHHLLKQIKPIFCGCWWR